MDGCSGVEVFVDSSANVLVESTLNLALVGRGGGRRKEGRLPDRCAFSAGLFRADKQRQEAKTQKQVAGPACVQGKSPRISENSTQDTSSWGFGQMGVRVTDRWGRFLRSCELRGVSVVKTASNIDSPLFDGSYFKNDRYTHQRSF
jgi:hypothetical protein